MHQNPFLQAASPTCALEQPPSPCPEAFSCSSAFSVYMCFRVGTPHLPTKAYMALPPTQSKALGRPAVLFEPVSPSGIISGVPRKPCRSGCAAGVFPKPPLEGVSRPQTRRGPFQQKGPTSHLPALTLRRGYWVLPHAAPGAQNAAEGSSIPKATKHSGAVLCFGPLGAPLCGQELVYPRDCWEALEYWPFPPQARLVSP